MSYTNKVCGMASLKELIMYQVINEIPESTVHCEDEMNGIIVYKTKYFISIVSHVQYYIIINSQPQMNKGIFMLYIAAGILLLNVQRQNMRHTNLCIFTRVFVYRTQSAACCLRNYIVYINLFCFLAAHCLKPVFWLVSSRLLIF